MKKKLSRLLCVLLVLTMVCAMVPAVSAADRPATIAAGTAENPYVMYVYDTVSFGCQDKSHKVKAEFVNNVRGAGTYSNYVSYNDSTRLLTANSATVYTQNNASPDFGYVKVTVNCEDCKDSSKTQTAYVRVYSTASYVTLKNASGTSLNNQVVNIGTGKTNIYFTINPTTVDPSKIKVEVADDSVAEVVTNSNPGSNANQYYFVDSKGNTYFQLESKGGSASTKVTLTADTGMRTEKSAEMTIITGTAGVLTVKQDRNTIVAQSNYSDKEYKTIYAKIGDTIKLTASVDSTLGKVADVEWKSWDGAPNADSKATSNTVSLLTMSTSAGTADFKVQKAGQACIQANLGGTTALVKVSVLSDITQVRAATTNGTVIEDEELKIGDTLETKVLVSPQTYEESSAKYAVWSSSDTDVVRFYKYSTGDKLDFTIDRDTGDATGATVRLKAENSGRATIKVELGSKSYCFLVTVTKEAETIEITAIPVTRIQATVRTGTRSEIVDRLNANSLYTSISGQYMSGSNTYARPVPVEWNDASISSDGKTAVARGRVMSTDGTTNYTFASNCTTTVTADVTLTDDAAVTNINVTASKDNAVENDTVRLTANATVEPAAATATYQWYVNGRAIDKATGTTLNYTIPKASVDSSTQYKFTCEVTATYKKNSTVSTSKAYTVSVDREYSVSVETTSSKSSFTVGDKIDLKATLYRLGSAQSSSAFSWQLFDSNGDNLSSNIATVSGSGATATVTTKAVKSAKGEKIVVRATSDYKGYSSSETITVLPAEAASVSQSVGSGDTIKASAITSAVTKAAGSNANVSYVIFDTTRSCTLSKSASSSSSVVDEKCYISGSGLKLSEVYVKTSASTASASYVAYDADDYVLATGTISFDTNETSETLSFSGATLKTCGGVSQIADEYPNASYVKFDLPKDTEAKLYFDYAKIASYGREVKSSDKFYLDAGKNDDSVEDVFVLPVYGAAGTLKIYYTAYSSSNSDLGTGTITLTVKSKTASSKFTDVTSSNTGYWSADSIDFGVDNGLFSGKSTYRFDPEGAMDRGMLVTVLYRAAGEPSVSGISNPFTDVKQKDYFYNAVLWAYKNKVVTGTSADKFSPSANVTREQIATILYRYMGEPTATGSLSGYSDRAKVSSYATTAMQWAIGKGYITGTTKTTLSPDGKATRAQVAVMLHRFLTF